MLIEMQQERDEIAEAVQIAPIIEANLQKSKLFISPGHPTEILFLPIVEHVLSELGIPASLRSAVAGGMLMLPFNQLEVPIHPSIAAHFGLPYGGFGHGFISQTGEKVNFVENSRNYVHLNHNQSLWEALITYRQDAQISVDDIPYVLKVFHQALASSTGSVQAEETLSRLNHRLGNTAQAHVHSRRATALSSNPASAWFTTARTALRHGDFLSAEDALRATLKLKPLAAIVHSELSVILERQERLDQALTSAETAFALDSWEPLIANRLARLKKMDATTREMASV